MNAVRGWGWAAGAALLLAGAAAAAGLTERRIEELPRAEPVLTERDRPAFEDSLPQAPVPVAADLPGWVPVAILLLVAVVVAVALVVLLRAAVRRGARRRLRPLRPAPAGVDQAAPDDGQLLAAVDAGLADLSDDDRDPRRAVIACWLRLEEAAAVAGTPRHDSDTATDLVVRLLRGHQVSEPVLAGLAEVYLLARFATHTVDVGMRDSARTALHRLRTELAGAVAAA